MIWNKREMDTKTGVNAAHCTANAGNVIIGAMRNSVQPCEWAGRYFMNGGGHVIAAPPKADISHWLSTRTQEISPLKQYRFQSPEMGATRTETAHIRATPARSAGLRDAVRCAWCPFLNGFFLWMKAVICKWEWLRKKKACWGFSISTSPRSIPSSSRLERIGANANTVGVLIDDYVLKSWRTTPRLKTQSFRIMFRANTHFRADYGIRKVPTTIKLLR